jgi:REP element-mobilizing transposase RayT
MARKNRVEFPGAFYHVFSRGNNKQVTFRDEQDFRMYLERLDRYRDRYNFILYAFVLMPNHIHFLLETGQMPLSKIMQGIQQSYTYYFHKRHKTVGHLFQGRYKAIICDRETYLLELVRYIHLNPVRKGLVALPENFLWSSHQSYIGNLYQPFVEKDFIFKIFSQDKSHAVKLYQQFIMEGMRKRHQDKFYDVIDQRFLGSQKFVEKIKQRIEIQTKKEKEKKELVLQNVSLIKKRNLSEILKVVSEMTSVSSDGILGKSRERSISYGRCIFAFVASRVVGINNSLVAHFLRKDDSSITYMIRKAKCIIKYDPVAATQLKKIIQIFKV